MELIFTAMPRFGTIDYWDQEFESGEFATPFDWLASWNDLSEVITRFIPDKEARIFIPGCGNAPFQLDMYGAGYQNMVCGDNSSVVLRQMKEAHADSHIQWDYMDATCMPYENASFDGIVDKSLVDCLLCCDEAVRTMCFYLDEVFRVLAPGGVFVIISCQKTEVMQASLRGRAWKLIESKQILTKDLDENQDSTPGACLMLHVCAKQEFDHTAEADCRRDSHPGVEPILRKNGAKERKKTDKTQRRMLQAVSAGCADE